MVPTLTTVNVTWNIPDIKGVRAGAYFFLEYRELGSTDWDRVIEEERESFWQEIKGLESGTSYQVRVTTRAGQPGNPSYREKVSDIRMFTTTYKGKGTFYPVPSNINTLLVKLDPMTINVHVCSK